MDVLEQEKDTELEAYELKLIALQEKLTGFATITADNTVEDNKLWIADAGNVTIGPGISKLYVVSTTGADAAIQIVRRDAFDQW